jgi:hypothetical protein
MRPAAANCNPPGRTIIGMIEGERACLEIAQARAAWGTA